MTILCNRCGESCESPHHPMLEGDTDEQRAYGMIRAKVRGHYGSHALQDLTEYTFSLCEICLRDLFSDFEIPVQTAEYIWGTPLTEEERRALAERLNSPPEKMANAVMANALDVCPELNDAEDGSIPIFVSREVWKVVQDSQLVSSDKRDYDQPDGFLHGMALYLDGTLTGMTIRVRDKVIDVGGDISS